MQSLSLCRIYGSDDVALTNVLTVLHHDTCELSPQWEYQRDRCLRLNLAHIGADGRMTGFTNHLYLNGESAITEGFILRLFPAANEQDSRKEK